MNLAQLLADAFLLLLARWLWRTGRAEQAARRKPGYVTVPGTSRQIRCDWAPEDETEYHDAVSEYRGEN